MAGAQILAVVFDLDGVLADSEGLHVRAWERALTETGLSTGLVSMNEWIGRSDTVIAEDIAREQAAGIDAEQLRDLKRDCFRRFVSESLLAFDGAAQAVAALHPLPLGLATSSGREEAELMLRRLGMEGSFEVIVSGDDVDHPKPAPDCYLLAVERLGVPPDRCVAIEDSVSGVHSAWKAGLTVLAVTNTMAATELGQADELFDSTTAAVDWILAKNRV